MSVACVTCLKLASVRVTSFPIVTHSFRKSRGDEVQYRQYVVLATMPSTGDLASVFTVHSDDSIGTGSAWLPSFVPRIV